MPADKEGSTFGSTMAIDPTSGKVVRRSLRLNPALATQVVRAAEVVHENPTLQALEKGGIDAAVDATAEEFEISALQEIVNQIDDSVRGQSMGGRKKMKGGASKEELIAKLKEYAKATLDYVITETGPVGVSTVNLGKSIVKLTQEATVRVPVSVAVLTISGTTFTANFFTSLFTKFNTWARTTGTTLEDPNTADAVAATAVQDLPSIARTTAVGVVFFNQLGLLPISAVIAALLYAVRVNVATGPGRSLLIAQFYTWYISRPKEQQKEILKSAREYTIAVGKAGSSAVSAASPGVSAAISALTTKLSGFVPSLPAAETKSMDKVLTEGAPAAAVVGESIIASTTAETQTAMSEEPNDTMSKKKGAAAVEEVVKQVEAAVSRYPVRTRQSGTPPISPGTRKKKEGGRKTRRKPKRRTTRRAPLFRY